MLPGALIVEWQGGAAMSQSKAERRVAFVQACWHKEIVDRCWDGFIAAMREHGYLEGAIDLFEVPGSFEIPLHAKMLARSGRYAAIVAAGLVVDGGIYRHEFVAGAVIDALMRIQLETEIPVISAVLTPQHFHAHEEHRSFFAEHFVVKGREAAAACAATVDSLARFAG
jgi:6,7-dimethyl-8-ribityllumazine synthase